MSMSGRPWPGTTIWRRPLAPAISKSARTGTACRPRRSTSDAWCGMAGDTTTRGASRPGSIRKREIGAIMRASPPSVAGLAERAGRFAPIGVRTPREVFGASTDGEIDVAFVERVRKGADALVVGSSVLFNIRRVQLVTLAAVHRLPTIYYDRNSVEVGGLMSYGASIADAMRQGGVYVGRVLKGEKPGDLPVILASKFEFVLNLQTARSLRIAVPASLLAQADEVFE